VRKLYSIRIGYAHAVRAHRKKYARQFVEYLKTLPESKRREE